MNEVRSHGIVLQARNLREADKLVTILTRTGGKVTAVARGVRKQTSKFKALVSPLTLGFFLLHRGRSLETLIQGEIVKPYSRLQGDLVLLAYAQYFCELCEASLPEREPAPEVFDLLLTALEKLEEDTSPARVARCFELNLLETLGYRPALDGCLGCGNSGSYRFDIAQGGLLCQRCIAGTGAMPVSGAAVAVMRRFLADGFHKLNICVVPAGLCREIGAVSAALLLRATGRSRFKSLDILHQLEEEIK
jgi:DNA repair protein RecO (recombination protein O)